MPLLLELVEDDLHNAVTIVHLAHDDLLALAHAGIFTFLRSLRAVCCLVGGLGGRMYWSMRELSHSNLCVVTLFLFSNAIFNLTELIQPKRS